LQSQVTVINGDAHFTNDGFVEVEGEKYSADHILVATGGAPDIPKIPGYTFVLILSK